MEREKRFYQVVLHLAIPVTLQSLLQSSFGVVDQVMTGQLGSTSIAGIGLGSKFTSIYTVLVSAVAAAAGIMIAQYLGKKEEKEVSRSFLVNLLLAGVLALGFTFICLVAPEGIMGVYTKDAATREVAAGYLQIVALSFLPTAAASLFSTLLRCMEAATLPLYASVFAAVLNTVLNYVLIFGKLGFPALGVKGAALATAVSQAAGGLLILGLFFGYYKKKGLRLHWYIHMDRASCFQYLGILVPILACEFVWSLGENVYAAIYGHIGTEACAAMTLTNPIQGLFMGVLTGVSQAAGILIGKALGSREYERAYQESKKLMWYGLFGAVCLSGVLILCSRVYVEIYQVEDVVKEMARQLLWVFAWIAPIKVLNMILGGGIIRSGGKTNYVFAIDLIGTWVFGVPLGILTAFLLGLPIAWVYGTLSLEECVRFGISLLVFRKRGWMRSLEKL